MRHTVMDTTYDSTYSRNEMQTLFAMHAAVRPVSKQMVPNQKLVLPFLISRLALWWQRRKQDLAKTGRRIGVRSNVLARNQQEKNPQRAASPLVSHRPAGRRVPGVPAQHDLFAVLDQMGARHTGSGRGNPFADAMNDGYLS